ANLDILEREELVARVAELEPLLEAALRPLESPPLVNEVRTGVGLLGAVEPVEPGLGDRIAAECVERGLLMRTITNGALQVSPPFVVSDGDVEFIGVTLAEALDAVAADRI
ncbi:MAG: aspartate aminotransferase family protein, partial [Actinobacteria bacterium]|nr:aspartate aminotransferase family protein [Actinomycetota bacterium]